MLVAGVVARASYIRREMLRAVQQNFVISLGVTHAIVNGWAESRLAQAELAAALLASDPGMPVAPRFTPVARALVTRDRYVGGWVLDPAGAVLAGTTDGEPGARGGEWPGDRAAGMPPQPASGDGPRVETVRCGARFCADFRAPIRAADDAARATVGEVVLRAAVDDSTFRPLNPLRPQIRTARTSVLARVGDSVVVVASVGAPGTPVPDRARLPADAPPGALGALAGRDTSGIGIGLRGERAILAAAHVTGASWAIVREIDEAEVLGTVRRGVLIEESLFSALAIALAILVRSGLRAVRLRREHEITRLRADFVSSVSHELRTPLAQIRMFAELLQRGGLRSPEEATRALRIIEKESSRLTILVDNVLNYARLRRRAESARVETLVPADVGDDVRQVLEAFAPLAAERGVRVVSTVPAGLYARIDSLALRQVLINYLENAVKYGPSGQTVTVGATAERDRVRVWVEDAGPGVPRAERELVWTAFQRGGSAEASGQGGSGIGLAVVRELVLQHGGAVAVETAAGGGARFVAEFQRATGVAG